MTRDQLYEFASENGIELHFDGEVVYVHCEESELDAFVALVADIIDKSPAINITSIRYAGPECEH